MATTLVAAVDQSVAAISIVVNWQESRILTGSVVDGPNTKYAVGSVYPAGVGSTGTRITLPEGWESLTAQLVVGTATNDIDLYITRDRVVFGAGVNTGDTTELFTLGRMPPGIYEVWAQGYAVTGSIGFTTTLTGKVPVHLYRVHPDGTEVEVLGSPVVPTGTSGQFVVWDTTAPMDVLVYYRATEQLTGASRTSNTVKITGQGAGWLKDPAMPTRDVHLVASQGQCPAPVPTASGWPVERLAIFLAISDLDRANASGIFPVLDAARPRSVSQTRKSPTGVLNLATLRLSQMQAVANLLAAGRPLLLQLDSRYGWGYTVYASDYVDVLAALEARVAREEMHRPQRTWRLNIGVGRAPAVPAGLTGGSTLGPAGTTFGDAIASGRTFAARTALGNTFKDTTLGVGL
jgi:hypothetical protein